MATRIPYAYHYDPATVITRNRHQLQVLRLDGFFANTENARTINHRTDILHHLINTLADDRIAIYQHTVRRLDHRFPAGAFPAGEFPDTLNDAWRTQLGASRAYVNELYLTIVMRPYAGTQEILKNLFARVFPRTDRRNLEHNKRELNDKLNSIVARISKSLADYGPKRLEVVETDNGPISLPLSFLGFLVNGEYRLLRPPKMDLAHFLPNTRPYFFHRLFVLEGLTRKRYGAMLGIKEYCGKTSPVMLNRLLALPHEFTISQSFAFADRATASRMLNGQRKLLVKSEDFSQSMAYELEDALDMLNKGELSVGWHHLSVAAFGDTDGHLNDAIDSIGSALSSTGINVVREDLNMENAYWAQLPGNLPYVARHSPITSKNFASLTSLHNLPTGKIIGNHWGPALTAFTTQAGTRYFFNYHVDDLGHTTVIGPSKSGKTLLVGFLTCQAMKYRPRVIYFDKDRGAEILIRALDGDYQRVAPGQQTGFNPLQLADSAENRAFLRDWLGLLLTCNGETLSDDDRKSIQDAVNGNYELDVSARRLKHIAPFLGTRGSGGLAARLQFWYGEGAYAYLFDNDTDGLDFDTRITGFDLTHLLDDSIARTPTIHYLFHRIEQVLDGNPCILNMDEGWKYVQDRFFETKLEDKLKTIRKKNGAILFATNDVDDAYRSNIRSTLIQQTATNIFFPNHKADREQYRAFGLSAHEIDLIRTLNPNEHYFLIKQGRSSVVAQLDLAAHPELITVLSSTERNVRRLDSIRKEVGDDPQHWLSRLETRSAAL